MKLEVGKTYRTRSRGKAAIDHISETGSAFGVDALGETMIWMENGQCITSADEGNDIVAEWTDENTDRAQLAALDASSGFNAAAHVQQSGETLNNGSDDAKAKTRIDVDYWPLKAILNEALEQASKGKGNERHANGRPFDRQPIMEHGRLTGPAGPSFQALKKIGEAQGMLARGEKDAAIRELLGAIVYACAAVQLIKEGGR